MAISHNRQGQQKQAHKRHSEKSRHDARVSNGQRKFLRKLINVLADIIDENSHFEHDEELGSDDTGNRPLYDGKETTKDIKAPHSNIQSDGPEIGASLIRFKELCNTHRQVTSQIQSSLKALGGGDRTAKALEDMHLGIAELMSECYLTDDKHVKLFPTEFVTALHKSHTAAKDVLEAFRELGVFNITFFEKLEALMDRLKDIAKKLELEFCESYYIEFKESTTSTGYFGFLLNQLNSDFETFLHQLTAIAEKEIVTIRQTQDFLSQRYLNLTTIATFLSSITATTLQITAGDTISNLVTVINTLWFLSLVFSTASAVYSLLVMTWRQSSVRQPDKSLPSWIHSWLRSGPMYALIIAISTFSIGLCLLAFELVDPQNSIASAIVPTAFAGFHAYAILIVSAYFLSEQWKERHTKSWEMIVTITRPVANRVSVFSSQVKDYYARVEHQISELYTTIAVRKVNLLGTVTEDDNHNTDLEKGQNEQITSPLHPSPSLEPSQQALPENSGNDSNSIEAVEPENVLAVPSDSTSQEEKDPDSTDLVKNAQNTDRGSTLEKTLEFSLDGSFLIHGVLDKLILYFFDPPSFDKSHTYNLQEGDRVLQVAWSAKNELLTSTSLKVYVWKSTQISDNYFDEPSIIPFEHHVETVRWLVTETDEVSTFACVSNGIVNIFNVNCENIRSFDLLQMVGLDCKTIRDVAFLGTDLMLCIVTVPGECWDWRVLDGLKAELVEVKINNHEIKRSVLCGPGQARLVVSEKMQSVIVYGRRYTAEIFNFTSLQYQLLPIDGNSSMFLFHSKNNEIIVRASSDNITLYYQPPEQDYLATLHSFSTRDEKARVQKPTSFAVHHSHPYMFAFGDEDGSVKVWSVQMGTDFEPLESAEKFKLEDGPLAEGREESIVSWGKFITLSPPSHIPVTQEGM